MTEPRVFISILIMAGVTYLVRMLPLVIFKKKITNRFVRSFLAYVPYAVLAAMTFPGILYSTGSVSSAAFGLLTALVLAYHNKGLLTVALGASAAVFAAQQLLSLAGMQ
ncbi:MAG: AzlD domain-containing protein [Clostridiales bacterium]|jgi:branched-subunit amino acid transport protein|nr:AzlD domain-containing protein [Clostridiales bacterium]